MIENERRKAMGKLADVISERNKLRKQLARLRCKKPKEKKIRADCQQCGEVLVNWWDLVLARCPKCGSEEIYV